MKKTILLVGFALALCTADLWAPITTMITNPGAPSTAVQFNYNGVFRGTSTFTYDPGSGNLSVTSMTASGHVKGNTAAFGFRPMIQSTPVATMADVIDSTTTGSDSLFVNIKSTAVQLSNLQATISTLTAGNVTAGQGNAGVIFSSMTSGLVSTGMAIFDLVVTTHADANIVVSSAGFVNIMGAEYVNVSTHGDLSKLGAGGIDAGTEIATEWYGFFFISNNAGTQFGCVLSTADRPNPMPSGYTKWRFVTYVRNNSSALTGFIQLGNRVNYFTRQQVLSSASPATSLTKILTNQFISSGAVAATFQIIAIESVGTDSSIVLRSIGTTVDDFYGAIVTGATANRNDSHISIEVMGDAGRDFLYRTNATIDELYIFITSYEVRPR